jgi:hypothetical protein
MTIEISGLNVTNGLDLCDGDMNIYLRFLRLYVSTMPAALGKLQNVSQETINDYLVSVHGVKGISQTIGADEVVKNGKELEAMAKAGDLAGILGKNDAFIKQAEVLVENIQSWLKNNNKN